MKPKTVGRVEGHTPNARQIANARGLMAGSIILTLDGEMPVEFLSVGDRVITRDSGVATVKSVRNSTVTGRAVQIAAGSLGHTRPDRDVTLPAGQPVLIRDWRAKAIFGQKQAMVPAELLADGEFVRLQDNVTMTLFEIELDKPHVIYVDGLELVSYSAAEAAAQAA